MLCPFLCNDRENRHTCRLRDGINPHQIHQISMHPQKVTVWCGLWTGGIIGPYFLKNMFIRPLPPTAFDTERSHVSRVCITGTTQIHIWPRTVSAASFPKNSFEFVHMRLQQQQQYLTYTYVNTYTH